MGSKNIILMFINKICAVQERIIWTSKNQDKSMKLKLKSVINYLMKV